MSYLSIFVSSLTRGSQATAQQTTGNNFDKISNSAAAGTAAKPTGKSPFIGPVLSKRPSLSLQDSDIKFKSDAGREAQKSYLAGLERWTKGQAENKTQGRTPDGRPIPPEHDILALTSDMHRLAQRLILENTSASADPGRTAAEAETMRLVRDAPEDLKAFILDAGMSAADSYTPAFANDSLPITVETPTGKALNPLVTNGGTKPTDELKSAIAKQHVWQEQVDQFDNVAAALEKYAGETEEKYGASSSQFIQAQLLAERANARHETATAYSSKLDMAISAIGRKNSAGKTARTVADVNNVLRPLGIEIHKPVYQPISVATNTSQIALIDQQIQVGQNRQKQLENAILHSSVLVEHDEQLKDLIRRSDQLEAKIRNSGSSGERHLVGESWSRREYAETQKEIELSVTKRSDIDTKISIYANLANTGGNEFLELSAQRVLQIAAPNSTEHLEAVALLGDLAIEKQSLNDGLTLLKSQVEVNKLDQKRAQLACDLEHYKTQVLALNKERYPHQFNGRFTNGAGEMRNTDRIDVVIKDGQLYQQNSFEGHVTGEYQLTWGMNQETKGNPPKGYDRFAGLLVQTTKQLDLERLKTHSIGADQLQTKHDELNKALFEARATHGSGIKVDVENPGTRPANVDQTWITDQNNEWVHPEVALLEQAILQSQSTLEQSRLDQNWLSYRVTHSDLVRSDLQRNEELVAGYVNDNAAERARYFERYQNSQPEDLPAESGPVRRNSLGKMLGLVGEPHDPGKTDIYAGEDRKVIDWIDNKLRELGARDHTVEARLNLHVSDEPGVGVEPIVHLAFDTPDGRRIIDASVVREIVNSGADRPWRFDNFEHWQSNNQLSEKGVIYHKSSKGEERTAAHKTDGATQVTDTLVSAGTVVADVLSFIPVTAPFARPAALLGGAYLGYRSAEHLSTMIGTGRSVWTLEGVQAMTSTALASLSVASPMLRGTALSASEMSGSANLKFITGATGANSSVSRYAQDMLSRGGRLATTATYIDRAMIAGGVPAIGLSIYDFSPETLGTSQGIIDAVNLVLGVHSTVGGKQNLDRSHPDSTVSPKPNVPVAPTKTVLPNNTSTASGPAKTPGRINDDTPFGPYGGATVTPRLSGRSDRTTKVVYTKDGGFIEMPAGDTPYLFRGDSRPPNDIASAGGFNRRNRETWMDRYSSLYGAISSHASTNRGYFVSTSTEPGSAKQFAGTNWVYTFRDPGGGTEVNHMLGSSPYPQENEIAFPGNVPWENVVGMRACKRVPNKNGIGFRYVFDGPFIQNPDYKRP